MKMQPVLPRFRSVAPSQKGYTLVETIGVLAIAAILAAAAIPSLVTNMQEAKRAQLKSDLANLVSAIEIRMMNSGKMPGPNDWAIEIAEDLAMPLPRVANTADGVPILFLYEAAIQIGTNNSLPYVQGNWGTTRPLNTRMILAASIGDALPISSGPVPAAQFQAIWETQEERVPAYWPAEWQTRGKDVVLHRFDLGKLFHQVLLNDSDMDRLAFFAVSTNAPVSLTNAVHTAFYIQNSVFSFYEGNGPLQVRDILADSRSYFFERNIWRGQLLEGRIRGGRELAQSVDLFLSLPKNPKAQFGATQQGVVDLFYDYMIQFSNWSRAGFPDNGSVALRQVPEYEALIDTEMRMQAVIDDLIFTSGQGGGKGNNR